VRTKNIDIFSFLLAAGAKVDNLKTEDLPNEYIESLGLWNCPSTPENYLDIEKQVTSLQDDLDDLIKKSESFIENHESYDFINKLITPVINSENELIVRFTKLLKRLDTYSKQIFIRRATMLTNQLAFIYSTERMKMEEKFGLDEEGWYSMVTSIKTSLESSPLNSPIISDIDNLLSQFTKKKEIVFPCINAIDRAQAKSNRSALLYLNQILLNLEKTASIAYSFYSRVVSDFIKIYQRAEDTIQSFHNTLLDLRQASFEVSVVSQMKKETQIEKVCSSQCDKLMIDLTYIKWEREQLVELSKLTKQCIRMSFQ